MKDKENLSDLLKNKMGYSEDAHQCQNCMYFELSDGNNRKTGQCILNRALSIKVDKDAICDHWKKENYPTDLSADDDRNPEGVISPIGELPPIIKRNGPDSIPEGELLKS